MPTHGNEIHVTDVRVVAGRSVVYTVTYGAKAGLYFSGEPFYAKYDRDIAGVPAGILIIPLLANLCPVAWVIGADVYVDELDRGFYESLQNAKQAFASLYPKIKFSGKLSVGRLTDETPPQSAARSALFFSGGVDSLASFIRRREQQPCLITIWGGDIALHQTELWENVKRHNAAFADNNGLESLFIKSNMRPFLNEEKIAFDFGRFTHGWWPGVQHGIGMVGLCAPVAYLFGIRQLHVASALPPKLAASTPDGSNTMINNRLRWAGTTVALDGEELGRQDKVSLIAEYIRTSQQEPVIRVCWSNPEYGNCCRCEKCLRTIAALLAEGIDPQRVGFPTDEDTLGLIRTLLPGWLPGNALKVAYWDEIRARSVENRHLIRGKDRDFFDWLQQLDMPSFTMRSSLKQKLLDAIPHPVFLYLKRRKAMHSTSAK